MAGSAAQGNLAVPFAALHDRDSDLQHTAGVPERPLPGSRCAELRRLGMVRLRRRLLAGGDAACLGELRRKDARVRVKFLPKNAGIAAATNAAAAIANGRYLVMVDHDDRVHPELLRVYHDAIQRDDSATILYCDEDKLDPDGRSCEPFFKPDWSPE